MTFFRKTLQDIIRLIKEGKNQEAKAALQQHIQNEHHMEGDIAELSRVLQAYQLDLLRVNRMLMPYSDFRSLMGAEQFKWLNLLEEAEIMMDEFELKIIRLQREGKLAK